jgi:hypothetical protein
MQGLEYKKFNNFTPQQNLTILNYYNKPILKNSFAENYIKTIKKIVGNFQQINKSCFDATHHNQTKQKIKI